MLKKISTKILYFMSLFCLSMAFAVDKQNTSENLQKPINFSSLQKTKLEKSFQILLENSYLGYVLFGNKPICIDGFFEPLTFHHVLFTNTPNFISTKSIIAIFKELNLPLNDINQDYILLSNKKPFQGKNKKAVELITDHTCTLPDGDLKNNT